MSTPPVVYNVDLEVEYTRFSQTLNFKVYNYDSTVKDNNMLKCQTDSKVLADEGCRCDVCFPQLQAERSGIVIGKNNTNNWVNIDDYTLLRVGDKIRHSGDKWIEYEITYFDRDWVKYLLKRQITC